MCICVFIKKTKLRDLISIKCDLSASIIYKVIYDNAGPWKYSKLN